MRHVPHFEIQFFFSCERQLKRAAEALLEDDLVGWSFTVAPTADSAERHILEIHDTPWALNAVRAGEIVEKACAEIEEPDHG